MEYERGSGQRVVGVREKGFDTLTCSFISHTPESLLCMCWFFCVLLKATLLEAYRPCSIGVYRRLSRIFHFQPIDLILPNSDHQFNFLSFHMFQSNSCTLFIVIRQLLCAHLFCTFIHYIQAAIHRTFEFPSRHFRRN